MYHPMQEYSGAERERPIGYVEYVSSDKSWEEIGIRIKWTEPYVPGNEMTLVTTPIKIRLCVETKHALDVPPDDLTAWCWTPIITEDNPDGAWKEIQMSYNPDCTQWDDHGVRSYVFHGFIVPMAEDVYRLTFNVKYKKIMVWANYFRKDNVANIEALPSVATQTPVNPKVHFASNFVEGQLDDSYPDKDGITYHLGAVVKGESIDEGVEKYY